MRSGDRLPRITPLSGVLLLAPFLVCFCLFWAIPLLWGIDMSLRSNALMGRGDFVGMDNYRFILKDPLYAKALLNTAKFTLFSIGLIIPLGFLLAHFIRHCVPKLQPILTFCLLLPGITPPAVLAILFLLFFHGDQGILNRLLVMPLGFEAIDWMQNPKFIMISLILQSVWRWTGLIAFFFLCGMDALPKAYNEMAKVEGSDSWRTLFHVTFPLVRHIIFFAMIFLFVDAFSMFSGAYSLLGGSGGPGNAGLLLISHIYHTGFGKGNFGDASAISLSIAPILLFVIIWLVIKPRGRVNAS